jgi:hypothetical protein
MRIFIEAVATYTGSKVQILAYSMGSPVARKAILGGVCVDTGENVGPPLSQLVHTFIFLLFFKLILLFSYFLILIYFKFYYFLIYFET